MFRSAGEGPEFMHSAEERWREPGSQGQEEIADGNLETFNDPTFQQVLDGIKKAEKGAVVFVGAITAPQNEHAFEIRQRGDKRGTYGTRLQKSAKAEGFVVISREKIAESYNLKSATEHAIDDARRDNPGATIVVESPLLFESIVKKPWESEGQWASLLGKQGLAARDEFMRWLEASIKEDAGEPKMETVLHALEHAKGEIKEFIETAIKGPFTIELPINAATLAFLTYVSTGELNAAAFRRIGDQFKNWEGSVAAVHFNGSHVQVTVGDVEIARERPAW